jgi:arylsulfatase A-like enzyme
MFRPTSKLWPLILCLVLLSTIRIEAKPPNIILINTDNLGYGDLGCYGSKVHRTPHIDQLAKDGIRFTDFFVASPVCTSSRAALLTGCYPHRNSMHEFEWDGSVLRPISPNGLHPDEITLAELLKKQGYFTACLGKWHLGDQIEFLPPAHGFDYFLGLLYSDEMGDNIPGYGWPPMPLMENNEVIEAPANLETMTRRYTETAQRLICENQDRPFFIYLPHMSPGSRREPIAGKPFQGKSANGKYGDTIEELDWSTGEILKSLDELDLAENTLVIWTADNGAPPPRGMEHHGSNEPLVPRQRYDAAEGGMRVPFIARWPGKIPAGIECREIATNMDLFPTIAKLVETSTPTDRVIDGKDIWPLLKGEPEAKSPHEAFYYYFGGQLQGVRSGKWKLHLPLEKPLIQLGMGELGYSVSKRYNRLFGDPVPLRLYDMEADISETTDLAEKHSEVVKRLMALAENARTEIGDLNRKGKGVRPAGHLENPTPRILSESRK